MTNADQPATSFPCPYLRPKVALFDYGTQSTVEHATHDNGCPLCHGRGWIGGGLTKREYFAAMAMQGLCAAPPSIKAQATDFAGIAEEAVAQSDALLAALEVQP